MTNLPEPLQNMINQLSRFPGVGKKSAQRLAYFLIDLPLEDVKDIANAIYLGKRDTRYCSKCGNYSVEDYCEICKDHRRNKNQICVVKDPRDVYALERMQDYNGLYHVLHGVLSPLSGVGPDDINISSLLKRVQDEDIKEIIIATNPDVEGEATANYIARLLENKNVLVTRIAHGVPIGSDLEYADEITLSKAFEGRRKI